MNKTQRAKLAALEMVAYFCTKHVDSFPKDTSAHEIVETIQRIVTELAEVRLTQSIQISRSLGLSASKRVVRKDLEKLLKQMIRAAAFVERSAPNVRSHFKLQRAIANSRLLYTAKQFLTRAEPHREEFFKYAVSLDQLQLLIDQFQQSLEGRSVARTRHKGATTQLNATLQRGFDAVAQLHLIIAITFRKNASFLDAWANARRIKMPVKRKPRKSKQGAAETGVVVAKPARKKRRR